MVAAQVAVRVSVWPETMEEVEALSARELPPSRERMRLRRRSGGLDLNTVRTNEKTDVLGAATDTQRKRVVLAVAFCGCQSYVST